MSIPRKRPELFSDIKKPIPRGIWTYIMQWIHIHVSYFPTLALPKSGLGSKPPAYSQPASYASSPSSSVLLCRAGVSSGKRLSVPTNIMLALSTQNCNAPHMRFCLRRDDSHPVLSMQTDFHIIVCKIHSARAALRAYLARLYFHLSLQGSDPPCGWSKGDAPQ